MKSKIISLFLFLVLITPLSISNYLKLVDNKADIVFCEGETEDNQEEQEEFDVFDDFYLHDKTVVFYLEQDSDNYFSEKEKVISANTNVLTPPPELG